MNLALFDFDMTITNQDTFIGFIRYAVGRKKFMIGMLLISPLLLAHKFKFISISKIKELFLIYSFKRWKKTYFDKIALTYSRQKIPNIIRPVAIKRIQWHKSQGDKIAVVSASIDSWLKEWCDKYELDLICSHLEVKKGIITGKIQNSDCFGEEKVKRINEKYNLDEYHKIYAYGDSIGDKEMLDMANIKYYRWKKMDSI